jgi:hypothetical protein
MGKGGHGAPNGTGNGQRTRVPLPTADSAEEGGAAEGATIWI